MTKEIALALRFHKTARPYAYMRPRQMSEAAERKCHPKDCREEKLILSWPSEITKASVCVPIMAEDKTSQSDPSHSLHAKMCEAHTGGIHLLVPRDKRKEKGKFKESDVRSGSRSKKMHRRVLRH
jgi:hypothetical protein